MPWPRCKLVSSLVKFANQYDRELVSNVMARIEIGKHLATDSRVCGGRLIFRGTRILVSDAFELAAAGYAPDKIASQYREF